jgi:sarcosine oxidase subunit beta
MKTTSGAVVIGGGVMGASIAYHLAKAGVENVALCEKRFLCAGATGKSTAIVRQHYSNEITARMGHLSLKIFENFGDLIGGGVGFTRTGMVIIVSEADRAALEANVKMQQALGVRTGMVALDDLKEIDPRVNVSDAVAACYEPDAGYADPVKTTAALARRARELGATIAEDVAVTDIKLKGERVSAVVTSAGEISTPLVINAAGGWAGTLCEKVGVPLPVQPSRVQVASLRRPDDFGKPHATYADFSKQVYFRPDIGEATRIGSVHESEGDFPCDPDDYDETVDYAVAKEYRENLEHRFPILRRSVLRGGWGAFYDITPDWHPVLDKAPQLEGFYIAAGFSGHGFKFGPLIGQLMTEIITQGKSTTVDLTPLRYNRFAENDLVTTKYTYGKVVG